MTPHNHQDLWFCMKSNFAFSWVQKLPQIWGNDLVYKCVNFFICLLLEEEEKPAAKAAVKKPETAAKKEESDDDSSDESDEDEKPAAKKAAAPEAKKKDGESSSKEDSDDEEDEKKSAPVAKKVDPAQQMLSKRLFPLIQTWHPDPELAGKIIGILLKIDNSELLHMLEHQESLKAKVRETVLVIHRCEFLKLFVYNSFFCT